MKHWFLAPVFVVLDQITKYAARTELFENTISLFPGMQLQLAFNKGFAFSFPAPQVILVLIALIVSGFLIYWSSKKGRFLYEKWAALLVASGAIGNGIDRVLFEQVTDFFSFWSFPIFNMADILVTLGVFVLLWGELTLHKNK